MDSLLLFLILALFAEILGTISGFGSSILFVPLASLFFEFKIVLGITAVFHVFSNLIKIGLFKKGINKGIVLKLGIPAVLFVILGALLTRFIPQKEIELGMNIMLLLLSLYLIINANKKIEQSNTNLITGGVISGFLAGLVGTGGAIRGLTLSAFHLEKDIFIATSAMIDLGVDSSRAAIYIWNDYFLKEHLPYIPLMIGISFAGNWIGREILKKTSEKQFRYLVLAVILITTIVQLIRYFLK